MDTGQRHDIYAEGIDNSLYLVMVNGHISVPKTYSKT